MIIIYIKHFETDRIQNSRIRDTNLKTSYYIIIQNLTVKRSILQTLRPLQLVRCTCRTQYVYYCLLNAERAKNLLKRTRLQEEMEFYSVPSGKWWLSATNVSIALTL